MPVAGERHRDLLGSLQRGCSILGLSTGENEEESTSLTNGTTPSLLRSSSRPGDGSALKSSGVVRDPASDWSFALGQLRAKLLGAGLGVVGFRSGVFGEWAVPTRDMDGAGEPGTTV